MRRFSFLISRYVLQAVLPYFIFSWILLSVILFVQQAGRYSDLLFNANLPGALVWQLTIALIPNVLSFTGPVAVLVGVIIGLSRMQGDSEMTSLRAAGVGNLQIALPVLILGIVLSLFAFFVNVRGVPIAAQIVREVAVQAALFKLESPIEPGVFNTEIYGYTIYVKNGNIEEGTWENIFIHQRDESKNTMRLITSKSGRIDTKEDDSEIVLENASVTTLEADKKIVSENVENLRLVIQTKRGELLDKLSEFEQTPDELGLYELAEFIQNLRGTEKREAQILLQRRIILSITPLLFALLGAALVLKFNRGGKGFGILLAFLSLIGYYLITLLSEQMARVGTISVINAGLIPILISLMVIAWLFISKRLFITRRFNLRSFLKPGKTLEKQTSIKNSLIDFTTGVLDLDLILSILKFYFLTLLFIIFIYTVFTAFELWKFAATFDNGVILLLKYLFYLIPFIYIQISPPALMIAVLATFTIKSRRNELVTWTAAGQSVYRLLLPCIILVIFLGLINFALQEKIIPDTNRLQDQIRDQIRSRNLSQTKSGKFWIATDERIYSFDKFYASDNENLIVENLTIYQFGRNDVKLKSISEVPEAVWTKDKIIFKKKGSEVFWERGTAKKGIISSNEIEEKYNPFNQNISKTTHLNIFETRQKIEQTQSASERLNYEISLQKKISTIITPLVVILFTAPFAMSIKRQGNVKTLVYAFGLWIVFMGTASVFEQMGQGGYLSPELAVWSPLFLFMIIGFYFISKIRT